jgi:hypothetical protein
MDTICDTRTRHIELEHALERARADYLEMPGLRLTARQASKLWALPPALCERVLRSLMEEHFLHRGANDSFVLAR